MLARRGFLGCAICAATGLVATGGEALAQATPGFRRTILHRADHPGETYATIQALVEVDPGTVIAWHTHPGTETTVILQGTGEFLVKGEATRTVTAADTFQVPPETPHSLRNSSAPMRLMAVFVVEKDKPLASPAPAPAG